MEVKQVKVKRDLAPILFKIIIALYLFIIIFPFVWIFLTSFKPEHEIWGISALKPFSKNPTMENYIEIFKKDVMNVLKNSLIVTSMTTIYITFVASLVAFAIARLEFRGKNLLLSIILATSFFPQMITVGPIYVLFQKLNILNSYWIVLPYSSITLPVATFILTTHFKKIPMAIEESAMIDGASKLTILYKIILPLALPGLFVAAIIVFITAWNEFLLSLMLNSDFKYQTAPVWITYLRGQFNVFWGQVAAATTIVTIPTLIIVLLFQRQIISGLTSGSVKE